MVTIIMYTKSYTIRTAITTSINQQRNGIMITGTLYIISAPSGAGKSSLINALLNTIPYYEARFSISHTTRPSRPNEKEGEHYFFVSEAEFEKQIQKGELIEYAKVFNHYYGTSLSCVENMLSQGIDLFLDIDWQGARQVREHMPTRSIFILPPSLEELQRRLLNRRQDDENTINQRMVQAVSEISHYNEYDYLIINDNFDTALQELKTIIRAEKLLLKRQQQRNNALISKLLTV